MLSVSPMVIWKSSSLYTLSTKKHIKRLDSADRCSILSVEMIRSLIMEEDYRVEFDEFDQQDFHNDIMEYDSKRSQRIRESQGEEDEGQDD